MSLSVKKKVLLGLGGAAVALLLVFALWVHPFLAPVQPVTGNVLVVEGWVPDEVLVGTVPQFQAGRYSHVLVSRMIMEGQPDANARRAYLRLRELGIPEHMLHDAPSPFTHYNRTAATARGVRAKLAELKLQPTGINLISGGPHSRQSWLAYRRMLEDVAPVGVIAIRKGHYNPSAWWTSKQGLSWVLKDFAGYLKEWVMGPRS